MYEHGKGGESVMDGKGLDIKIIMAGVTVVVTVMKTVIQLENQIRKERKCIRH